MYRGFLCVAISHYSAGADPGFLKGGGGVQARIQDFENLKNTPTLGHSQAHPPWTLPV